MVAALRQSVGLADAPVAAPPRHAGHTR